jgi:hypothetical protein
MNPGGRHLLPKSIAAQRLAVVAVLALCTLSMAACAYPGSTAKGRANDVGRVLGVSHPSSPAGRRASRSPESSQIISAWWAAEEAFDTAALTADSDQPSLAATMVSPQLDLSRLFLKLMARAGELGQGTVDNGAAKVVSVDGNVATVKSCVHDNEIAVFAATGRPVPGILGVKEDEYFTSTMELGANGWKLSAEATGVGQCD